ncbi:MAG: GAF domain-containing sensor histidine kinase [Chloroflexi bacterium]|nr:GAF domain-containing sensor histidine kinase [Chloroflexota bacterium]
MSEEPLQGNSALERVLDISRRMAENRELQPLLEFVMQQAVEFSGGQHGYLVLVEPDGTLNFQVKYGNPSDREGQSVSRSIVQQVISTGEPLLSRNALEDANLSAMKSVFNLRLQSILCVPLRSRGKLLGVLYLENRDIPNAFTRQDIPPLNIFAGQAAIAIENAQLNEQRERFAAELEERVRERTVELEEARWHATANWEAAMQENRLRTALLSNIAHDLRSPLNTVVGALDMMKEGVFGDVTEDQVLWIDRSLTATRQILRLVSDIFDLSKLEQGGLELYPETLEIGGILEQTLAIAEGLRQNDQVELAIEMAPNLPPVWGDFDRIQQILVNLVSNALKFTTSGTILVRADLADEETLLFRVADSGEGIPAENLPTIFDRFSMVDLNLNRRRKGTGLGLAICKELVEQHGGQIWVESQVGVGTTFSFTLPVSKERENAK